MERGHSWWMDGWELRPLIALVRERERERWSVGKKTPASPRGRWRRGEEEVRYDRPIGWFASIKKVIKWFYAVLELSSSKKCVNMYNNYIMEMQYRKRLNRHVYMKKKKETTAMVPKDQLWQGLIYNLMTSLHKVWSRFCMCKTHSKTFICT